MSETDFSKIPQVKPITSMSFPGSKLLALQQRWTCFRAFGNVQLSLKITLAPNLAANIPGNAVPQPISSIRLPTNFSRWIHKNLFHLKSKFVCILINRFKLLEKVWFHPPRKHWRRWPTVKRVTWLQKLKEKPHTICWLAWFATGLTHFIRIHLRLYNHIYFVSNGIVYLWN